MSLSGDKEAPAPREDTFSYSPPAPAPQPAPSPPATAVMSMQSGVGNAAVANAGPGMPLAQPSDAFALQSAYGNGSVAGAGVLPAAISYKSPDALGVESGQNEAAALPVQADAETVQSEQIPAAEETSGKEAPALAVAKAKPGAESGETATPATPPKPVEKPEAAAPKKAKEGPAIGEKAAGKTDAKEESAETAAPPSPREAIAPATKAVRQRAAGSSKHRDPGIPVASAQAAGIRAKTEQTRDAAALTVGNLDAAEAEKVKRDEFKTKLRKAIADATPQPKTEAQADKVMKTGAKDASAVMQGQLATERDVAAGPLKSAAVTEATPSNKTSQIKESSLEVEQMGNPPAPVAAGPVVPAPLPPERLDYSSDRGPTDQMMAENQVSKEQMEKGNDPEFGPTLEARSTAETHEAEAEATYRQSESGVQKQAQGKGQQTLAVGLTEFHGTRAVQMAQVIGEQVGTTAKNATERQRITDQITSIKDKTRSDVTEILNSMETGAAEVFEAGLKKAEKAYEDTFEEEKGGVGTWLTTWGDDWEELIENSLGKARQEFLKQVDLAIDKVADLVEYKLKAAKTRVADGLKEVETFVKGLDESVKQFGEEALESVSGDFDAMVSEIDQRRDGLIDKLTQQYKASYERMSAMEEKLREANKSLWQRVYDATVGLIKKIIAFKDMLLGVLAKAADVIGDIISDPIGFLGNLVSAVMQGLEGFISRLDIHLKKGLMEWLFGALGGAGLQLPDKFDLQGIISIVLQILGLTYANFRARAVAIVGEDVVSALETTAEVFKVLVTEGVSGLWRFIQDKLADLKAMVIDGIMNYIMESVIKAGIMWIIGLLNPASAFFKACKAIYDIVMFFINRGSQILAFVNAVLDSIAAIAKGSLGKAAAMVEESLAKAIPVAIGFLAGLLGLGDPSKPVRALIDKAQEPVNKAIDWVINLAVKAVKAAGSFVKGLVGGKKKGKEKEDESTSDDPATQAKIDAANAFIDQEESSLGVPDEINEEQANMVVSAAQKNSSLFKSISVKKVGEFWEYNFTVNPPIKKKTPAKPKFSEDDDEQNLQALSLSVDKVPHPPPRESAPSEVIGPKVDNSRSGKKRIWSFKASVKAWRYLITEARFKKILDKEIGLEADWWNTVPGQESAQKQLAAEEKGREWLASHYKEYVDLTPASKIDDDRTPLQKVSTPGIDIPALGTVTDEGATKKEGELIGREAGKEVLLTGEAKHSDYPGGRNFPASETSPSVASRAIKATRQAAPEMLPRVEAALASGNIVYTIFLSGGARFSANAVNILSNQVRDDLAAYLLNAGYTIDEIKQAVKNVIIRTQRI